jgi:hypothetical protein
MRAFLNKSGAIAELPDWLAGAGGFGLTDGAYPRFNPERSNAAIGEPWRTKFARSLRLAVAIPKKEKAAPKDGCFICGPATEHWLNYLLS